MAPTKLALRILSDQLAICRLDPNQQIPDWVHLEKNCFLSITKTSKELSIVCLQDLVPDHIMAERDWRAVEIQGPLSFSLTGVLSSILNPLAENQISIFAISTFDTDYVLIKEKDLDKAVSVLQKDFQFIAP
jgi:hypothetical protein